MSSGRYPRAAECRAEGILTPRRGRGTLTLKYCVTRAKALQTLESLVVSASCGSALLRSITITRYDEVGGGTHLV